MTEASSPTPVLEMRGISQIFPGVKALDGVDIALYPGKVTALIGENGAGKSTLVKILTGIYRPNEGEILLDGKAVHFHSAQDAIDAGVTAIHQETVLFDELSVGENIFLGHAPKGRFGLIDWKTINERARILLEQLESTIDPTIRLKDLSIAQRHLVAIARALSVEARIVIMDEPTAALSRKEIDDLFRIVENLKRQGKAILFISHKFDEVYEIAENYAVFRDGKMVGAGTLATTPQDEIVRLMVGRDVTNAFPKQAVTLGPTVLSVRDYSHQTEFRDISLDLRKGEILGLYGLIGAGRSELCQSLFGITRPASGEVTLDGQPLTIRSPEDAIRAGIVYVPEERGRHGLALDMPIYQNMHVAKPDLCNETTLALFHAARPVDLRDIDAGELHLHALHPESIAIGHTIIEARAAAEGKGTAFFAERDFFDRGTRFRQDAGNLARRCDGWHGDRTRRHRAVAGQNRRCGTNGCHFLSGDGVTPGGCRDFRGICG